MLFAAEMKFVAMVYTDKSGKGTDTRVGIMIGDTLMEDPGGAQWAANLSTLLEWVKVGVIRELARKKVAEGVVIAPKEDKVDILGSVGG